MNQETLTYLSFFIGIAGLLITILQWISNRSILRHSRACNSEC